MACLKIFPCFCSERKVIKYKKSGNTENGVKLLVSYVGWPEIKGPELYHVVVLKKIAERSTKIGVERHPTFLVLVYDRFVKLLINKGTF